MVVQNVVFLAQDNCRTLCRNTLDVKRVSIGEVVLDLIQYLKDFACKSDAFIGVTDVTKLIRLGVTKCLDDFIQTKDTHCAVLLVHLDRAILIVGEQPLLNVSLDDMAYSIECLTTQQCTLFEQSKILFLVTLSFQRNPHEVDCVDLHRTDGECCAANRIDECVEF